MGVAPEKPVFFISCRYLVGSTANPGGHGAVIERRGRDEYRSLRVIVREPGQKHLAVAADPTKKIAMVVVRVGFLRWFAFPGPLEPLVRSESLLAAVGEIYFFRSACHGGLFQIAVGILKSLSLAPMVALEWPGEQVPVIGGAPAREPAPALVM